MVPQGTLSTVPEQGFGFSWTPSVRAGTTVLIVAGDNRGPGSGGSATYIINYGTDNSCLNDASPSSTSGPPAGGSYPTSPSDQSSSTRYDLLNKLDHSQELNSLSAIAAILERLLVCGSNVLSHPYLNSYCRWRCRRCRRRYIDPCHSMDVLALASPAEAEGASGRSPPRPGRRGRTRPNSPTILPPRAVRLARPDYLILIGSGRTRDGYGVWAPPEHRSPLVAVLDHDGRERVGTRVSVSIRHPRRVFVTVDT